jgi:lysozyme family protein
VIEIALALTLALGSASGPGAVWEGEEMPLTPQMRSEYESKYSSCTTRPEFKEETEKVITKITKARERYEKVAAATRVPWQVIAVIHNLECSGDFGCHLHNGDTLRRRTVNVPAGRPTRGKPPFSWEESAKDALTFDGFSSWPDWSVAGTLYKIEGYNGMGYRKRNIPSPYLWSGSPHYGRGKFVADGRFDPQAVSSQLGAATLLREMEGRGLASLTTTEVAPPIAPKTSALPADHDCTGRK